jgi:precorrin-8X/cobalt-precorrin-8 methylmutase
MRRGVLRDPAEIYRQSFETIRRETDLGALPGDLHAMAVRLVHACGMPDIVPDLRFGGAVTDSVRQALAEGAPILADAKMVAMGIMSARLPAGNEIVCTVDHPQTAELAARLETTRSAAAVELWRPRLAGAVVAIGNAPTALFHLLDLLAEGASPPAAILGFPVGFVGAAESKEALVAEVGELPYATLLGRRGGSALAAAAVNACLLEAAQ